MKTTVVLIFCVLVMVSCGRTEFKLRVANELVGSIDSLEVGPVYFGTVQSGVTTNYSSIEEGIFEMRGKTGPSDVISGSVHIAANTAYNETHEFTLTLISDSTFLLVAD